MMDECLLCEGYGYVHLLMGGTDTCLQCKGTGKKEQTESNVTHA